MEGRQKKTPISQEVIYKIMLWVTFVVSGLFLVKNVVSKNMQGTLVIGGCLLVFATIMIAMKLKKAAMTTKEMVLSVSLVLLVFIISLFSGASYSDDFPLFLAVIGMTGLYLEPKFTRIQIFLIDICLVIMYIIHPEKAGALSQYILCAVCFTLAATLFSLTIHRGRAFIGLGEERAEMAEKLVASMQDMGKELETDFAQSSSRIENNTQELQRGSVSIIQGANDMTNSCHDVQDRIQESEQSIADLSAEVNLFEETLTESRGNVEDMSEQLASVTAIVHEANERFQTMEEKMSEVKSIAEQLNTISFSTSLLALNASIEAARAGEAGVGFDVVAAEMRDLSNNSNVFSEQVSDVIKEIMAQVEQTAEQFMGSTKALHDSREKMDKLQESFEHLTKQFDSLYNNIETQNNSVNQVNVIFNDLKEKVVEMQKYSADNQEAVDAIVEAMDIYRGNIGHVIENTKEAKI